MYRQIDVSKREQTSIARGLAVASADAPLGNTTDNSAIRTQQGFQAIKERFKLLDSARKILDGERTQHCFYNRVDKNDGVGVTFNKFRNKANYTNVMRCANAWGCPVCAAIISEHRKCEVKEAMDWWKKQGGSVLLLTLTVPHYSDTDIKQLKKDLKKAYGKFFKGVRASKDMFERWQIKHYISCFEITHGTNGFHPHYHVLLFVPYSLGKQSLPGIKQDMYKVWKDCCLKAGLDEPSEKHGLDLQAGNDAANYVAKWGLEHEMTKGHIKKGKENSRTPFDILRSYTDSENEADANLFKLYYFAFKGTRQLNWSKGLKKLVSKAEEKTDQEIVDDTDNVAEMLFKLDIEMWNAVRKQKKQGEL
ncbi:protein rep, partial [Klebsiella pneumoniae]